MRALPKRDTLSSNVSVITLKPNKEMERWLMSPGVPIVATSNGTVIWRSISSAALPGYCVMTCTCTFVRSGNASMRLSTAT